MQRNKKFVCKRQIACMESFLIAMIMKFHDFSDFCCFSIVVCFLATIWNRETLQREIWSFIGYGQSGCHANLSRIRCTAGIEEYKPSKQSINQMLDSIITLCNSYVIQDAWSINWPIRTGLFINCIRFENRVCAFVNKKIDLIMHSDEYLCGSHEAKLICSAE